MTGRQPLSLRLTLLLVIALAFGLRLFRLDYQELRGDEAFGYFFSLRPFGEIVRATLELKEPHPVGSYFAEKVWLGLAGHSEFGLRFLSVWFGVLAVALLYRLARRLGLGVAPARLGMLLLAVSPYAVWHSQDARMYTLSLAMTVASTLLALEVLHRQRWPAWLAYIVVSLLALHTHYYAAFILLAQNVFVLSTAVLARRGAVALRWSVAQGLLAVGYAPWLWRARSILVDYGGNGDSPGLGAMIRRSLGAFAVGQSMPRDQQAWFALLAGLLILLGAARLVLGTSQERRAAWLLLLYLGLPLGATWASALNRPIFNERYLVAASPAFYLLLAMGLVSGAPAVLPSLPGSVGVTPALAWRARHFANGALLVAVVAGMGVSLTRAYTDPAYSKTRGWRLLVSALDRFAAGIPVEQVRLAQNYPDPTLWYYYTGPVAHLVLPPGAHDVAGADREVGALVAARVHRVILPLQPAESWDDRGLAQAALVNAFALVGETRVGRWPLQVYARIDPAEMVPVRATFQNGLTLAAAAIRPSAGHGAAVPGGVVIVHLRWDGRPEALAGSEKLFLHLLDATGTLVAQADPFLSPADITSPVTSYGIFLPDTLAPGTYHLVAGLYDPAQPGSPRLLTAAGADAIEMGVVRVTGAPLPPEGLRSPAAGRGLGPAPAGAAH
ncbi:MAG: glycosyltransferase family 39 protein [Ardenticatenaceae bacterium]|nr:glycosyltransferase family 39 protein [Ardenticatenaceae bacterium]